MVDEKYVTDIDDKIENLCRKYGVKFEMEMFTRFSPKGDSLIEIEYRIKKVAERDTARYRVFGTLSMANEYIGKIADQLEKILAAMYVEVENEPA